MTKFNKVLAIHCHTTGMDYGSDVTLNNQALTVALGVVDMESMKMTDTKAVKIKFDGSKYVWNSKLESIHGISKQEAVEDGETLSDAASILGEFLYEHFGIKDAIPLLGYNPTSFHLPFLNKILLSEDLAFKFDNRSIDLFSLMAILQKYTVKEMFEVFEVDQSIPLSSLTIIKTYLKIFNTIKHIIKEVI
jgi:hypothetical protein